MTEADYILATEIAKVRLGTQAISAAATGSLWLKKHEREYLARILYEWEDGLAKMVEQAVREKP